MNILSEYFEILFQRLFEECFRLSFACQRFKFKQMKYFVPLSIKFKTYSTHFTSLSGG